MTTEERLARLENGMRFLIKHALITHAVVTEDTDFNKLTEEAEKSVDRVLRIGSQYIADDPSRT